MGCSTHLPIGLLRRFDGVGIGSCFSQDLRRVVNSLAAPSLLCTYWGGDHQSIQTPLAGRCSCWERNVGAKPHRARNIPKHATTPIKLGRPQASSGSAPSYSG